MTYSFRHSKNGFIWIQGERFAIADFVSFEPGYSLPPGAIERNYDGSTEWLLTESGWVRGNNETALNILVSNLSTYIAKRLARRIKAAGIGYAETLAEAKMKKAKEMKRVAVGLYLDYRNSDLEIPQVDLDNYKAALVAQKPIVIAEIGALNAIGEVRQYQYSGWPAP